MYNPTVSFSFDAAEARQLLLLGRLRKIINSKKNYQFYKRLFDISLSFVLILFFAPFMLLISIPVCFSPGKGIFYCQPRYGLQKKPFILLKFRSMNNIKFNSCSFIMNGYLKKDSLDPRVTRFGKLIRKTSIDELPQLFNILIGDMSFVGPRPLFSKMVADYPIINSIRSTVKPGLTGLWQVSARQNHHSVYDMINFDIEYINNCGFIYDIKIILKTVPSVLKCKGAV